VRASKLTDRVYADTSGEGKGNIGAIALDTYTLIIDSTFSIESAKAFRESLRTQVAAPISKLVLTHYHSDHTLGIPVFKDCEIIASEPYRRLRRSSRYQPTRTFENSLVVRDGRLMVEIVLAGGHTEDSSYIYFPHEKVLFSGDLIFSKTFFYAGDKTFNPKAWLDVLKRFLSMEVNTIVPGHGLVCDKREVSAYAKFFENMSKIARELVKDGAKEKKFLKYEYFPMFYPEYRKGVKDLALVNWYKFYKREYVNSKKPKTLRI
jgi:glyoxylase-like metal-dependent hydrolase (beta-lactamase superfamily II)